MKKILTALNQKSRKESIIIYEIFILLMVIVLLNKTNYHIDELLSYGLANSMNGIHIQFDDGLSYIPAQSPWLSYMTVHSGERFDFQNVWENQAADVHPPFYYLLLHIVCSYFPEKYSIWFAGSINIIFALLTLWVVRRLAYELTSSHNMMQIVSVCFTISAGMLSAISFLRMYIMTLFLVSLITLLFVLAIKRKMLSWRFYGTVIFVSYIGALTHYYYIVYLFFLCLVFGVWLLIEKRYKETICFVFSMGLCGGLAIWTFPNMLEHMFLGGYRGQESIENLKGSASDYLERLGGFYRFINDTLFGGFLTYAAVLLVLLCFLSKWIVWESKPAVLGGGGFRFGKCTTVSKELIIKWLLLIIPSICYFLLVSKMAVYITDRYLVPVYGVLMVWVLCGMLMIGKNVLDRKNWYVATGLLLTLMTVNSWKNCNWDYLHKNIKPFLSDAEKYSESNCLYIYDTPWKVTPSYLDVSQYNSITFYKESDISSISNMKYIMDENLVVYIINKPELFIKTGHTMLCIA